MILFPPAKINLGLNVLSKRNDGYHELETVMIPIPFTDILEILPSKNFEFHQTGLTIEGELSSNLCVKAYELMKNEFSIPPLYMHLRKIIPMGGGLGGGSADAAFILSGINSMFQLGISNDQLEELAGRLGSDCPFFIQSIPQVAKGRGEILTPIKVDLSGLYLKIINLGIHVGTKEAYAGVQFSTSMKSVTEVVSQPISTWKDDLTNDFEKTVFAIHPILKETKEKMYEDGAVYAAMSGSGSTLFGIFEKEPELTYRSNPAVLEMVVRFP